METFHLIANRMHGIFYRGWGGGGQTCWSIGKRTKSTNGLENSNSVVDYKHYLLCSYKTYEILSKKKEKKRKLKSCVCPSQKVNHRIEHHVECWVCLYLGNPDIGISRELDT